MEIGWLFILIILPLVFTYMQFQKFKVNEIICTQMHLEKENMQQWNFNLCFL